MRIGNYKELAKRALFLAVIALVLFFAALLQVSSEEETVKYADLEKEQISDESQEQLNEYFGAILGDAGNEARFNTIASKNNIAILNVTIDGKDRRILTKLSTGMLLPVQVNITNLVETINLIVHGNISLGGLLFSKISNEYGDRNLLGIASAKSTFVDEGFSRLYNGKANVSINPILRGQISSYNVFLSAESLTQGIYVAEKRGSYFIVKGVNPGSNAAFSWMLRGVRAGYGDMHLSSVYGKEKGIQIMAIVDIENGLTKVRISGLSNASELVKGNVESTASQPGNLSSTNQITGNVIEEIIPETDLSEILADEPTPLPELTNESGQLASDSPDLSQTGGIEETITIDNAGAGNLTSNETARAEETRALELTLNSTDENYVMDQVAFVTSLSLEEVKKLIEFAYKEPENFEDEAIGPLPAGQLLYPEGIEKVNGSIIIRVG